MSEKKPVILLVLDGWGHREESQDNAIALAQTPHWDTLWATHPHLLLSGSGHDVGLPDGQMGNSEVGHLCLGAGRVIYQDFERINHAIQQGTFQTLPTLVQSLDATKINDKQLHIMALLSPGGVHSHQDHVLASLESARSRGIKKIYLHAFLDGRDTPPQSAMDSLKFFSDWFAQYGHGRIASICGRYYAMDRDSRYERTELAYNLLTKGEALYSAPSAVDALQQAYKRKELDEFVKPTVISHNDVPTVIEDGDTVLFMNFRADRARQISHALTQTDFSGFKRHSKPNLGHFITLTEYDSKLHAEVLFPSIKHKNVLGAVLSQHNKTQLRISETEKYAHVTFFFNGGVEQAFPGEERILIPSPKVATYDLQPEMSAPELTDALVEAIHSKKYDFILCNYPNADMVGHTGNLKATICAIEVLDHCLSRITQALQDVQGCALITADHGNAELMHDPKTEQPHTAHTTEKVPLIYVGPLPLKPTAAEGILADVAPTLCTLLNLNIPHEMTGKVCFT